MEIAYIILITLPWLVNCMGEDTRHAHFHVTRHNTGDLFKPEGIKETQCQQETCVGLSSGTAQAASTSDLCKCQCHNHLPTFREDLRICVDNIHECVLAPFVGGSTSSQSIPFVFLPLKGQIVHPSKEISFTGIQTPVCAVSGAKFLTDNGWLDLRNPTDADVPFRLFRDEGRTYLQWIGEPELRAKLSGRLILVYLMCRELATTEAVSQKAPILFSPCVAFRVVGSSTKYLNNVSEVAFASDAHSASDGTDTLSISQYIAITICSILLGLIYVASIFLYLYLRKRNRDTSIIKTDDNLPNSEEGIIKNNPLLTMTAHFPTPDPLYSDSSNSDTDATPDILQHHDERAKNNQITSALVHSQFKRNSSFKNLPTIDTNHQDTSGSIEKLPEENVSIVETLEGREDRPDSLKAITGTVRRKLYFNPAYFEPQLLMAPPPAALEFLAKIREVISIAKQKMASKRFSPSLMGIPEEDSTYALEPTHESSHNLITRRNSIISLKRENSRRKNCTGCPGCEPDDFQNLSGKLPEFKKLGACLSCSTTSNNTDSKQYSIRKWLEDVPVAKEIVKDSNDMEIPKRPPKRIRSPTRSLPSSDGISSPVRALSPRPKSENGRSPTGSPEKRNKPKAPQPPQKQHKDDNLQKDNDKDINLPPPDMIHEAMVVDKNGEISKQLASTEQRVADDSDTTTTTISRQKKSDYETDSLERSGNKINKNGYNTPSEYGEISSQPSPSLSAALPMDEEMTIRNAIFNKNTGNMTISKINVDKLQPDDEHDYELIILKKGTLKKHDLYHLPELLQRANGYNLVSEVYVNNGYNYGSAPSTASNSNCSTLENRLKVRYDEGAEKPGKLLIEVEDCANNYIPINDSDSFEPDTLDRKPSKIKSEDTTLCDDYVDSLERPPRQILLRTNGSFKKEPSNTIISDNSSNFNRVFGSLREIYEAKTKGLIQQQNPNNNENNILIEQSDGKILTLEERHSKRQRRMTISNGHIPDVIPPPPHDSTSIYEHPKPPRKVIDVVLNKNDGKLLVKAPPLQPKNANGRSTSLRNIVGDYLSSTTTTGTPGIQQITINSTKIPVQPYNTSNEKRMWKKLIDGRREDSGYLSTDSNDSKHDHNNKDSDDKNSESEGSLEDGHSESGAESIETHSVFFDNFRKPNPYSCYNNSADNNHSCLISEQMISDNETANYIATIIQR